MKVKATHNFESIIDKEVGRTRTEGEVWEVSSKRLAELKKGDDLIIELDEVNTEVVEPKEVKKAVRKTTKKSAKN